MGQVFHREIRYSLGGKWKNDSVQEDTESKLSQCQPESIERLMSLTRFSRRELKMMYRGFKQTCPTGFITIEHFKEIFAEIFPHGDSSNYATFVFNAIGEKPDARMTFGDIALVLSILCGGSPQEKLEWTFRLYDINRDGFLTFDELLRVMSSIHSLMGTNTDPPPDQFYLKSRAKELFEALDVNADGSISRQQFVQACLEELNIELQTRSCGIFGRVDEAGEGEHRHCVITKCAEDKNALIR